MEFLKLDIPLLFNRSMFGKNISSFRKKFAGRSTRVRDERNHTRGFVFGINISFLHCETSESPWSGLHGALKMLEVPVNDTATEG